MTSSPVPDPNDWRTWRRDGRRLFPPPGTTWAQSIVGMQGLFRAKRGIDPAKARKINRNVIRVLKQVDGKYVQVSFARVVDGRKIDVRVRGGCRI